MKIEIEEVENGYIVRERNEYRGEDAEETELRYVFQWDKGLQPYDDDKLEKETIVELLTYICDALNRSWSKYDKYQIKISLQHGRDYCCEDEQCDICNEV